MQEINEVAGPKLAISPKWTIGFAWFTRIIGVLILAVSIAAIIQAGGIHSLRGSGLRGLLNATLLLVLSFNYTTTGRTKSILSAVTAILVVLLIAYLAAVRWLP
jgi:hypothetical protein